MAPDDDLSRFFDLSLDLFCTAGLDGYFRRLNPSWKRVLGYETDELLAKPFMDFVHPDDRAATLAELGKLAGGVPTVYFENRYRCKDGSYRWLAWSSTPEANGTLYAVARDVSDLKRLQAEIAELTVVDALTGISNYRAFQERLGQLLSEGRRGRKFALILCDVDDFKNVNDVHGHPAGDAVLVAFARVLRQNVRTGDCVARYGGDEFGILLADADEEEAAETAEKLRLGVAPMAASVPVTGSFGVCEYSKETPDGPALLAAADRALYRAKDKGKNTVVRAWTLRG